MDIKKLGKLRQWAGEVISSREKASVNEEFAALEKDIELRKEGINKIIVVSDAYHRALTKKESCDALKEDEKLLPIDRLGIVMIQHGGEFGEDSTFGNALLKLGGAHCQIATLQEAYALIFKDTFLTAMEKFRNEIKEYESLRKSLDTRKSAADSATAKFEKVQSGKKEKEMMEAQDDMERMKQRYEETVEDLRAYMHSIQENELNQLQELSNLVEIEINFAQNYLNVLKEVRIDFQDNNAYLKSQNVQASRRTESAESIKPSDDGFSSTFPGSQHGRSSSNSSSKSNKSVKSVNKLARKRTRSLTASIGGTNEEKAKRMSMAEWASSAMESVTGAGKTRKNKSDKDSFSALGGSSPETQDRELGFVGKPSTFRSITRLASLAPGSSGNPKDASAAIGSSSNSSRPSGKILKPQSVARRKTVRAVYDFSGSSDELSFRAGTEIVVLNELMDDWWMGEIDGQTGLFPASHVEIVGSPELPPSLSRSSGESRSRKTSLTGRRSNNQTPKSRPIILPVEDPEESATDLGSDHDAEDEDLRDLQRTEPMLVNVRSPVYFGRLDNDSESITTDGSEALEPTREAQKVYDDGKEVGVPTDDWVKFDESSNGEERAMQKRRKTPELRLTPKQRTLSLLTFGSPLKAPVPDPAQQPLLSRSKSEDPRISITIDGENSEDGSLNQGGSPMKKTPPPPPPRRPIQTPSVLPPIPVRKVLAPSATSSTGSLPLRHSPKIPPRNLKPPTNEYTTDVVQDRSPFESVVELGLEQGGNEKMGSCDRFRQNPFKRKGMCSNCLKMHEE